MKSLSWQVDNVLIQAGSLIQAMVFELLVLLEAGGLYK